ncbi:TetR/AcrR family transcriptional regulator [Pseudonocardia zijingensis]|jgi:AcrR family transcriptional regulator|uniref:TetR/AcrR family transcriptional regulator n=1 Tax=Pseudonocardia zijingensis TaxID=153376 RepID=A0ABP3YM21_9PSEU
MRADAARNLDAVLEAGARLLADDPGTSVGAIAAAAGVDRRTVYRRFPNRDALLCAVFEAKLDALDDVLAESRLAQAPVGVALHRLVEGVVAVNHRYPVAHDQMACSDGLAERSRAQRAQVEAFVRRAQDEGLIRDDLPDGVAHALLYSTVSLLARQFPELDTGRAADLAVEILLGGIGRR